MSTRVQLADVAAETQRWQKIIETAIDLIEHGHTPEDVIENAMKDAVDIGTMIAQGREVPNA